MAEDLGFIEVRIPDADKKSVVAKAAPVEQQVTESLKEAAKEIQNNFKKFETTAEKFGTLKDVVTSVTQGGGIRATASAAAGASAALGAAASPMIAVAIGIGAVAVAAKSMLSFVSNINSRVADLARVSATMARESAINRLDEIKRDIKEARVMGPMYSTISSLTRGFLNAVQPAIMLIKLGLINIVVPIMRIIIGIIQAVNYVLSYIVQFVGSLLEGIGEGIANMGQLILALASQMPGWLDAGGLLSTGMNTIGKAIEETGKHVAQVGVTAKDIAEQMRKTEEKKNDANQWAKDTLRSLSSGLTGPPARFAVGTRTRLAT